MSFRYTNNLISTIKQRALLREYQRTLFHKTFTGTCGGILVRCNASGEVLDISHTADAEDKYREEGGSGPLNASAVAASVKLAVWEAMRNIHATKDELYQRSIKVSELMDPRALGADLSGNNSKSAQGLGATSAGAFLSGSHSYNPVWFAENATSIGPFVYDSVHDRAEGGGTSGWFYGGAAAASPSSSSAAAAATTTADDVPYRPTLAHIFPESAAHLMLLNDVTSSSSSDDAGVSTNSAAIQQATATEMSDEESTFWSRVEAIRRAQQTVLGTTPKRGYLDDPNGRLSVNDFEEKVSLRFV